MLLPKGSKMRSQGRKILRQIWHGWNVWSTKLSSKMSWNQLTFIEKLSGKAQDSMFEENVDVLHRTAGLQQQNRLLPNICAVCQWPGAG